MSNGNTPRDDAELEKFLARQSPLSTAYDAIDPVQPPEVLDAKILAIAKGAASPAPAKAPAIPAAPKTAAASGPPPAANAPPARPSTDDADDDDEDDAPPARRPRWLVPSALAASVLVAVGIGVAMLGTGPSDTGADRGDTTPLGAMFAKRARERREADKASAEAAAAAASQEAEVELAPLPPPPVFEPEGPQVEDLDTAIALIRRELVLANQMAAIAADEARAADQALEPGTLMAPAPTATPAEATSANGVIQPRDRRLAKILELYDGGSPDLAADSLEIFLRDFEDDPISQRILDAQPKATDVAVE